MVAEITFLPLVRQLVQKLGNSLVKVALSALEKDDSIKFPKLLQLVPLMVELFLMLISILIEV